MKQTPLSDAQQRHLTELVQHGPYWYPNGAGEFRCANALVRRGMLKIEYFRGCRVYELTDVGRQAVSGDKDGVHVTRSLEH